LSTLRRKTVLTSINKGGKISIFKAHSARGASTSAAANASVLIEVILKMADWSTASTFWKKLTYKQW
jgi:hypothetical protein